MAEHYDTVKGVDWREVLPWTTLTRAFSVAVSIPVLLLAAIGTGLTVSGWQLAESLLIPEPPVVALAGAISEESGERGYASQEGEKFTRSESLARAVEDPAESVEGMAPGEYDDTDDSALLAAAIVPATSTESNSLFQQLLHGETLSLIGQLHEALFGSQRDLDAKTGYALCIVDFSWLLIVWGFFGATITRIAVIRIGRGEKIGLKEAMADVRKKYISYVMSPLFVLVSCFVLSLPIVLISLLLNFDIGVILASILWIVVLVAGIGVTVLLTGFFFGWPLMWPTISAEESGDVYEATSRAFAYTFQAPLQYLFYTLVSIAIWVPSVMLVQNFTTVAEQVVFSGMSIASEEATILQEYIAGEATLDNQSDSFQIGANILYGLHWFGHLMADAFCVGFFFASFSGVYLLLRRFVDHTPLDEVFVIDDKTKYGLDDLIKESSDQPTETAS